MAAYSKRRLAALGASVCPIAIAAVLAWIEMRPGRSIEATPAPAWVDSNELEAIYPLSATELLEQFRRVGYESLPYYGTAAVPRYAVQSLPHDLIALNVEARKSIFFRALLPIVVAENQRIRSQRQRLLELFELPITRWTDANINWVVELKDTHRVSGSITEQSARQELLHKIDELPAALVLAQAANESAWGTSRFARLGNNLFGLWTYDESQGIVPANRAPGEKHAVQVFPDISAAVRAYFQTINSHTAYAELRELRSKLRRANLPLDSRIIAGGLRRYSSRGDEYVASIRELIERHRLTGLRNSTLRAARGQVVASRL